MVIQQPEGIRHPAFAFIASALTALCFVTYARADIEGFYLDVSPKRGPINESFALAVVVEGEQVVPKPVLSGESDFTARYLGPETRVEIVNGRMTAKMRFRYQLTAKREGTLTTPSAEIEFGGTRYTANSVTVDVGPAGTSADEGAVLLEQEITPTEVYEGQQTVLELRALIRTEVFNSTLSDPTMDDFWHVALSERANRRTVRQGVPFIEQDFRSALYPLRPGQLHIPARELNGSIRSADTPFDPFGGDLFEHFFGANQRQISVKSNAITLTAKPLPPAPSDLPHWNSLNPLVGKTTLRVAYPPGDVRVGESKTLEVIVTSTGNLAPVNAMSLATPPTVRLYEESPEAKNFETGDLLSMRKTFRFSVIAVSPGEIRIPGPLLAYFDPIEGRYEVARGEDITFAVTGTAPEPIATESPLATTTPVPPLRYEEPGVLEQLTQRVSFSSALFGLALIIGCGLIARLSRTRKEAGAGRRDLLRALNTVDSPEQLRACLGRALDVRGIAPHLDGEELRATLRRSPGDDTRQLI